MNVMRVTPNKTGIRSNALLAIKLAMPVCPHSLTFGSGIEYLAIFSETRRNTGFLLLSKKPPYDSQG
jgi:hypothetical protein